MDYAGPTVAIVNPITGEIREAQIFVAVLGASKVREVLERGGFSSDEPLDSIELISSLYGGTISPVEIGAYSSVLAFAGEWDRAEAVARSIQDHGERNLALSTLAQRLAAADLLEKTEAVVRSIPTQVTEVDTWWRRPLRCW